MKTKIKTKDQFIWQKLLPIYVPSYSFWLTAPMITMSGYHFCSTFLYAKHSYIPCLFHLHNCPAR